MRYAAVFGDQSLFDGANDCHVFACKKDGGAIYWHDHSILSAGSVTVRGCIAMRRIIAEPKRWTVEDQKAGLLPDVGAEFQTSIGKRKCVITEGKFIFTVNGDAVEVFTIDSAMPIETPEEKAQRLREEWCSDALSSCSILSGMQRYELKRLGGYIEDIYDALLSGDLSTPVQAKDGE